MKKLETVESPLSAADVVSVEGLLDDLELGPETGSDEVIEHVGELDAAGVDAVEAAVAKAEAYEEQPVAATTIEAPAVTEPTTETTTKKARKARTAKVAKAKVERDLSVLPVEVFTLNGEDADEAGRAATIALRPTQKKIGEKFDNLFQSIAAGRKPSVYTMTCFAELYGRGEVTSADLVAALQKVTSTFGKNKGSGYNISTARSQAGQMMTLFSVLGIATRSEQTLTFNKNSTLAAKLVALA